MSWKVWLTDWMLACYKKSIPPNQLSAVSKSITTPGNIQIKTCGTRMIYFNLTSVKLNWRVLISPHDEHLHTMCFCLHFGLFPGRTWWLWPGLRCGDVSSLVSRLNLLQSRASTHLLLRSTSCEWSEVQDWKKTMSIIRQ
jgi:hypothetical protein